MRPMPGRQTRPTCVTQMSAPETYPPVDTPSVERDMMSLDLSLSGTRRTPDDAHARAGGRSGGGPAVGGGGAGLSPGAGAEKKGDPWGGGGRGPDGPLPGNNVGRPK